MEGMTNTADRGIADTKKRSALAFNGFEEKAAKLWEDVFNSAEKTVQDVKENAERVWGDSTEKIEKLKKTWKEASEAEKDFCRQHPIAAYIIGKYQKGSDNISTVAAEFAFMGYNPESDSILSGENKNMGTGGQNAMRHVLLQAFTTAEFNERIAKQSADAHENNLQIDMNLTHFKFYEKADMAVDQRNNEIGRSLGGAHCNQSRLDIVREAVERFKDEGFWIAYKTKNGYELKQVKLGENRYEGYIKALENKDENCQWIKNDK